MEKFVKQGRKYRAFSLTAFFHNFCTNRELYFTFSWRMNDGIPASIALEIARKDTFSNRNRAAPIWKLYMPRRIESQLGRTPEATKIFAAKAGGTRFRIQKMSFLKNISKYFSLFYFIHFIKSESHERSLALLVFFFRSAFFNPPETVRNDLFSSASRTADTIGNLENGLSIIFERGVIEKKFPVAVFTAHRFFRSRNFHRKPYGQCIFSF